MGNKKSFLKDISLVIISVILSFFSIFVVSQLGLISFSKKTDSPDLVASIREAKKSVVNIFCNQENGSKIIGSGVMYTKDFNYVYIITNHHVIEDQNIADNCFIYLYNGNYNIDISLVGSDSVSDIAVLKASLNGFWFFNPSNTPILDDYFSPTLAKIGPSMDKLQVGETVFAVGNPYGLTSTVTVGVISSIYRALDLQGYTKYFIQTDAAINGGNSGGGLFNRNGELIGINDLKIPGSAVDNLAFSIPILYDSNVKTDNTTYAINKIDALTTANILRANGEVTATRTFGVAFDYLTLIIDDNLTNFIYIDEVYKGYELEDEDEEWLAPYVDTDDITYYYIVSEIYKGTEKVAPYLVFDRGHIDFKDFDACSLTNILYLETSDIGDDFIFVIEILSITSDGVGSFSAPSDVHTKISTLTYTYIAD